jgi:hypothetical protein
MSAIEELMIEMQDDETVEKIVFGPWGWGSAPVDGESWKPGYGEPDPPPVPFDKRGVLLSLEEAAHMMQSWHFGGGYGAPNCYATYIWTNKRILWVTNYDGATKLDWVPRSPIATMPYMPGGG